MVQILMSTYNGEKYLEEQIRSLLQQSYKNIKILIRDDGSNDKTKQILEEYKNKYPNIIECIYGKNIGVIASFLELINLSDTECEYFAFCDQDDYWLQEKIEKAVSQIKINIPFLYFSNKILVDEKLKIIKTETKQIYPNKECALIENLATGCTIIINKQLINYIKYKKINLKNILMHDWLIYILANFVGEVYHDKNAYIYYRQHSNNVVGIETNIIKKYYKRIIKFLKKRKKDSLKKQIKDKENVIKKIIESKKLFEKILLLRKLKRQNVLDNFIFKVLFLLGWL